MRMSARLAMLRFLILPLLALPLLALSACLVPMPEFPSAEEMRMMPQTPGDDPLIMPPQLVTPEMSDRLAFDQAVAAGTSAGLIMFLARNPDTAQAPEARRLLDLRRIPDSPAVIAAAAGGDAGVVAAFDAARLAGTRAAWDMFLARHGGHPLAAQVAFFSR